MPLSPWATRKKKEERRAKAADKLAGGIAKPANTTKSEETKRIKKKAVVLTETDTRFHSQGSASGTLSDDREASKASKAATTAKAKAETKETRRLAAMRAKVFRTFNDGGSITTDDPDMQRFVDEYFEKYDYAVRGDENGAIVQGKGKAPATEADEAAASDASEDKDKAPASEDDEVIQETLRIEKLRTRLFATLAAGQGVKTKDQEKLGIVAEYFAQNPLAIRYVQGNCTIFHLRDEPPTDDDVEARAAKLLERTQTGIWGRLDAGYTVATDTDIKRSLIDRYFQERKGSIRGVLAGSVRNTAVEAPEASGGSSSSTVKLAMRTADPEMVARKAATNATKKGSKKAPKKLSEAAFEVMRQEAFARLEKGGRLVGYTPENRRIMKLWNAKKDKEAAKLAASAAGYADGAGGSDAGSAGGPGAEATSFGAALAAIPAAGGSGGPAAGSAGGSGGPAAGSAGGSGGPAAGSAGGSGAPKKAPPKKKRLPGQLGWKGMKRRWGDEHKKKKKRR